MRRHLMYSGRRIPKWFREHIVCWYSPNRQGATNEGLSADPRLIDLSGKGMDLELVDFAYTPASGIDAEGVLQFDGKAYGRTKAFGPIPAFTYVAKRKFAQSGEEVLCGKNAAALQGFVGEVCNAFQKFANVYTGRVDGESTYVDISDNFNPAIDISWLTQRNYKGVNLRPGGKENYKDDFSPLTVGKIRVADNLPRGFHGALHDFFFFDTELTVEQIQWVKNNLID